MVLKVAEIENDYDHEIYECMRMEGAVTAQLAPHPLLVDIFVSTKLWTSLLDYFER